MASVEGRDKEGRDNNVHPVYSQLVQIQIIQNDIQAGDQNRQHLFYNRKFKICADSLTPRHSRQIALAFGLFVV